MKTFTVEKFTVVDAGTYTKRVSKGLVFSVDPRKDAPPIDLSGRKVSKDIYKKYFAPAPEPEPEPEQKQEQEEE